MDLGIKGRAAIVTGGSRGIGRETARQFLEEGVRVMICGRNEETLEKTRAELAQATGGEVHATVADMTREGDIERLVAAAKARFGTVDILVNNAGQMYSGRFAAMTDEGLKQQLETKLFGFLRAIRLVYPMMKERRWGRIVNLIGGAGCCGTSPSRWGTAAIRKRLCHCAQPCPILNCLSAGMRPGRWEDSQTGRHTLLLSASFPARRMCGCGKRWQQLWKRCPLVNLGTSTRQLSLVGSRGGRSPGPLS